MPAGCRRGADVAIRFACSCGKTLKVADDLSGRDITCPSCGRSVTVPTPEEAEQLEVAPLEDFDDGSPEGPSDPDSGRPADMAEAARESRRAAHRDRRRDAPVRPGKARLSADQRREAREGIREERKRRRESRKGVARPGKVRPSAEARREAKQGLREEGKRRRESRRGVPRGGRISAEAAREARAGLDEEERRRRESSRLVKGGAPRARPPRRRWAARRPAPSRRLPSARRAGRPRSRARRSARSAG